jgi:predicted phage terminase large subunit-like protein
VLPPLSEIRAEQARRSFHQFVKLMWPVLEPGREFVDGLHVRLICDALEKVTRGETTRLLINLPFRHGKSNLVSILWPAWVWIDQPGRRWLTASYAQPLAERHSTDTRRVIESREYQQLFGNRFQLSADVNQKARYETTRGGGRIATSVGGGATGEGGDFLIVDDPHKLEEGSSRTALEAANEWFDFTLSTRLNPGTENAIVVVCQRVHQKDFAGHLIDQGGWTHLCLPAEYDPQHPYLCEEDQRTQPGELLWPDMFGPAELEGHKKSLGSYGAAAQLQQLPAPAGGGLILRSWWKWYQTRPKRFDEIIISVDLSFSGAMHADYTVAQVWGKLESDFYLLHQERERAAFTQQILLVERTVEWVAREVNSPYRPGIYIERAANADAMAEVLRNRIGSIRLVRPVGSKESRAIAISPTIEAGHVHLPGAPNAHNTTYDKTNTPQWAQQLVEECAAFPTAPNDDQVDALTQAIQRLNRPGPRVRALG